MKEMKERRISWQEFEEVVRDILESHGFETRFRVVFRDEKGRGEIDVVAERFGVILAIDAKRYTERWYRKSAIRREAEKHVERCRRYSRLEGREVVPVIVSFVDDEVVEHGGCIVVPFRAINDFLLNLEAYLVDFGFL